MRLTAVRPMLAVAGGLPDAPGWAYELKWDGMRVVLVCDDAPRALTLNGRDVLAGFPELRGVRADLPAEAVLDGELVALDGGRPSFGRLQQRMHVGDPHQVSRLVREVPVTFLAFDLLALGGEVLLELPYEERRRRLEALTPGTAWDVPDRFAGPGADVLGAARAGGLEGVVAKRLGSAYEPGRRSPAWVKTKVERHQEVVVVGWKPGSGRRTGLPGSLLLAVPGDAGGLRYAGHVGTGFTDRALVELAGRLAALAVDAPPTVDAVPREHARDARWVAPRLVGEVAYAEWTADRRLRHPAWRGLRPDREPSEVRREPS